MTLLLALALLVAVLLVAGARYERRGRAADRARPLPGRLVPVDGVRLHVTDDGGGGPAVVVIAGMGDCSFSWTAVRRAVAGFTRVLTYDRPGFGRSDDGPGADPARSVAEVDALLDAAGVSAPVVLVGHSLGGLIARLYAQRHPERVAGLVLVDPTHEDLARDRNFAVGFAAMGVLLGAMRALSPFGVPRVLGDVCNVLAMYPERPAYAPQLDAGAYRAWTASYYRACAGRTAGDEARNIGAFLAEAARLQADPVTAAVFADLPLTVITNPGYGPAWTAMHAELAGRSRRGTHLVAPRPGHSVQMTCPDLVVDAIRATVEAARGSTRASG